MPSGKKRKTGVATVQGATLSQDQLNLWFHKPSHLQAMWVLALTEGTATPLPMDCLRATMDLWNPNLDKYIQENRAEITDSWIIKGQRNQSLGSRVPFPSITQRRCRRPCRGRGLRKGYRHGDQGHHRRVMPRTHPNNRLIYIYIHKRCGSN